MQHKSFKASLVPFDHREYEFVRMAEVAGTHEVPRMLNTNTGSESYVKHVDMRQSHLAQRELSAQQLQCACYPFSPFTDIAQNADKKLFVTSAAVPDFISLRSLVDKLGKEKLIEKINADIPAGLRMSEFIRKKGKQALLDVIINKDFELLDIQQHINKYGKAKLIVKINDDEHIDTNISEFIQINGKQAMIDIIKNKDYESLGILQHIETLGKDEVIARINSGQYKGLGNCLVMRLLANDADVHTHQLGIDGNGNFVNIDGDWTYARLRFNDPDKLFNITTSVLNALPKLDDTKYIAYNWFDQFGNGMLELHSPFLDALGKIKSVQTEIQQQILISLMMPSSYIKTIFEISSFDAAFGMADCAEHFKSRMQMLLSAANQGAVEFRKYLQLPEAEEHLNKFITELGDFRTNDGRALGTPDEIRESVRNRFDLLKQSVNTNDEKESLVHIDELLRQDHEQLPDGDFLLTMVAIEAKDNNLAKNLIRQDELILDLQNAKGYTPLLLALDHNNIELASWILENYPRLNLTLNTEEGDSALIMAVMSGRLELVKAISNLVPDVNHQSNNGLTALHVAASDNQEEIFDHLIAKGADPTISDKGYRTVVSHTLDGRAVNIWEKIKDNHDLIRSSYNHAVDHNQLNLALMIRKVAGVTLLLEDEKSRNKLLVEAARHGDLAAVKLVMKKGNYDINHTTTYGSTPLIAAAKAGSSDVLEYLGRKADEAKLFLDYSKKDAHGATAFRYMVDKNLLQTAVFMSCAYAVDASLLKSPIDSTGITLLHEAARAGSTTSVKNLIYKGASPLLPANNGMTPIEMAVKSGANLSTLNEMLKYKEIPQTILDRALILAAKGGDIDIFSALIKRGANINYIDDNNKKFSPLMMAALAGHSELVMTILENIKPDNINHKAENDLTALGVALENKQYICAFLIIENKHLNVEQEKSNLYDALHDIIMRVDDFDAIALQVFIDKGVKLNTLIMLNGPDYTTPLIEFANKGQTELVSLTLQHLQPSDVGAQNSYKHNALDYACAGGHLDCVNALLATGQFDCSQIHGSGTVALRYGLLSKDVNLSKIGLCDIYHQHGFNFNAVIDVEKNETVIFKAIRLNDLGMIKYLCNVVGVDPFAVNKDGLTPAKFANDARNKSFALESVTFLEQYEQKKRADMPAAEPAKPAAPSEQKNQRSPSFGRSHQSLFAHDEKGHAGVAAPVVGPKNK